MAAIRSIILDDEADARDLLENLLAEECPGLVEVIAKVGDIPSAVESIGQLHPDLLFLDIKLRAAQSFDIFNYYPNPDFGVVFITGYEEFALRGFKFAALHYLLKPVDREELKDAVGRAMAKKHEIRAKIELMKANRLSGNKRIALGDAYGLEFHEVADIVFIRAEGNRCIFHFKGGKTKSEAKPLKYFENLLDPETKEPGNDEGNDFFRCQNSYLVNLGLVKRLASKKKGGWVWLKEIDDEIPVSESKIAELRRRLGQK